MQGIFARSFTSLCVCGALLSWSSAWAAKKPKGPPAAISHIFPAGGKAGSTFPCTVAGTFTKTKTKTSAWADHPGIVWKSTDKPGAFEVSIAADVPPGPHLVRFYNEEGASPSRVFMVGVCDEVLAKKPNNDIRHPQPLAKIPVTVNGVIEKADEGENFSFHAEAGRWVVLALDGYGLGVQMDPVMRLLDERGVEVAMNHDTYNLDPLIAYEVKKAGTYTVEVMAFNHPPAANIRLMGSADHVYRLTITDGPYARFTSPCAVPAGHDADLKFVGWNFGPQMQEAAPHKFSALDPQSVGAPGNLVHLPTPNGETVLAAVVTSPVLGETEPNNDIAKAQQITLPVTLSGQINAPKDEDRFRFSAKKGEVVEFHLHTATLHSPLDAVLNIEDAQGKVLKKSNEGLEGVDPQLKWTAPANGEFIACVRDLYSRGGWQFVYALECAPSPLRISATLDAPAYKIEPGKTTEVKVSVNVSGQIKGKLSIHAEGLPDDVLAKETEVPAKGGEVKLTLSASEEAKAGNQSFAVVVTTSAPDGPLSVKATSDIRGAEPRGDRLINDSSQSWLTVIER